MVPPHRRPAERGGAAHAVRRLLQSRWRLLCLLLGLASASQWALSGQQHPEDDRPAGGGGEKHFLPRTLPPARRSAEEASRTAETLKSRGGGARAAPVTVSAVDANPLLGSPFPAFGAQWEESERPATFPAQDLAALRDEVAAFSADAPEAAKRRSKTRRLALSEFFPAELYQGLRMRLAHVHCNDTDTPLLDANHYVLFADYFYHKHRRTPLWKVATLSFVQEEAAHLRGLVAAAKKGNETAAAAAETANRTSVVSVSGERFVLPRKLFEALPARRFYHPRVDGYSAQRASIVTTLSQFKRAQEEDAVDRDPEEGGNAAAGDEAAPLRSKGRRSGSADDDVPGSGLTPLEGALLKVFGQSNSGHGIRGLRPSPLTCFAGRLRASASRGTREDSLFREAVWEQWMDFALRKSTAQVRETLSRTERELVAQGRTLTEEHHRFVQDSDGNELLNVNPITVLVSMMHDAALMRVMDDVVPDWDAKRRRVCAANSERAAELAASFLTADLSGSADVVAVFNPPVGLLYGGGGGTGIPVPRTELGGYRVVAPPCAAAAAGGSLCSAPLLLWNVRAGNVINVAASQDQVSEGGLVVTGTLPVLNEELPGAQVVFFLSSDSLLHEREKSVHTFLKGVTMSRSALADAVAAAHPTRRLVAMYPPHNIQHYASDFTVEATSRAYPDGSLAPLPHVLSPHDTLAEFFAPADPFFKTAMFAEAKPVTAVSAAHLTATSVDAEGVRAGGGGDLRVFAEGSLGVPKVSFAQHFAAITRTLAVDPRVSEVERRALVRRRAAGAEQGAEAAAAPYAREKKAASTAGVLRKRKASGTGHELHFHSSQALFGFLSGEPSCEQHGSVRQGPPQHVVYASDKLSRMCVVAPETTGDGNGGGGLVLVFQQLSDGGWRTAVTSEGVMANGGLVAYSRAEGAERGQAVDADAVSLKVIAHDTHTDVERTGSEYTVAVTVADAAAAAAKGAALFSAFRCSVSAFVPKMRPAVAATPPPLRTWGEPPEGALLRRNGSGAGPRQGVEWPAQPPLAQGNTALHSLEVAFGFDPPLLPPVQLVDDYANMRTPQHADLVSEAFERQTTTPLYDLTTASSPYHLKASKRVPWVWTPVWSTRARATNTSAFFTAEEALRSPTAFASHRGRGFVLSLSTALAERHHEEGTLSVPHALDVTTAEDEAWAAAGAATATRSDRGALAVQTPLRTHVGLASSHWVGGVSVRDVARTVRVPPPHVNTPLFAFTLHAVSGGTPQGFARFAAARAWALHRGAAAAADETHPAPTAAAAFAALTLPFYEAAYVGAAAERGRVVRRVLEDDAEARLSGVVATLAAADAAALDAGSLTSATLEEPVVSLFGAGENNLRYAFASLYWAERMPEGVVKERASVEWAGILRLLATAPSEDSAPRVRNLFPTTYAWATHRWVQRREEEKAYFSPDNSATVFWLWQLQAHFSAKVASVFGQARFAKRAQMFDAQNYGLFLAAAQRRDGSLPVYFDADMAPYRSERAWWRLRDRRPATVASAVAATAVGGVVLSIAANAELHDTPVAAAERKALRTAAVDAAVFVETVMRERVQQQGADLAVLGWVAWQMLYTFHLTGEERWLESGEGVLAQVSCLQQTWSPPRLRGSAPDPFGGFSGATHAADGGAAHAALLSSLYAEYHAATGVREYLQRAAAAVRSLCALAGGTRTLRAADSLIPAYGASDEALWYTTEPRTTQTFTAGLGGAAAASAHLLSLFGDVLVWTKKCAACWETQRHLLILCVHTASVKQIEPQKKRHVVVDSLKVSAVFGDNRVSIQASRVEAAPEGQQSWPTTFKFLPAPPPGYTVKVNGKVVGVVNGTASALL